jgi:crotonobetainyl-CoA:carnitine CoA-transferase CaiB-like acyl-CoA transferase
MEEQSMTGETSARTREMPGSIARGPLDGLRVIDVTAHRAGPTCVRVLADLGAAVIQVARPVTQAATDPMFPNFDMENLHRNKRSIAIDLQHPDGRELFLRLVKDADVLIENYRPGVKHRLGIDYETLSAVNPRLVYGSISGFGQDGPYANRPGVDQIAQGLGGLMSVTGPPGSGPWRVGVPISDLCSGLYLAHAVLAALYERERSGRGQWVQTSLLEAMIAMLDFQATRWLIGGEVPPQAGNDHPTVFPMGVFDTADGQINIAAGGGRMWIDFLKVLGLESLAADERFRESRSRNRHRQELRDACQEALLKQPSQHWIEALNAAGVPCGPILSIDQVFDDPQVQHLAMAQPVESPHYGDLTLVRPPMRLSRTPSALRQAAPRAGEHSFDILMEHGLSEDEARSLIDRGIVGA